MKSSAEKQELWMHMWVVSGKSLAGRIRLKQFPESVTDLRWIYETLNKDLFSDYMYHWYRQGSFSIPLIVGKIRVYRISTVMKAVYSEQISYSLKIKQAFLTIRNRMPTTKCAPK